MILWINLRVNYQQILIKKGIRCQLELDYHEVEQKKDHIIE